jgi:hypothetical protein
MQRSHKYALTTDSGQELKFKRPGKKHATTQNRLVATNAIELEQLVDDGRLCQALALNLNKWTAEQIIRAVRSMLDTTLRG